jgi:3-phosphoshikimate 1-carboxyvinyltransferase
MELTISAPARLRGSVQVPGDRSITVRAILLAAIADGVSVLAAPLVADDTAAARRCAAALGVEVSDDATTLRLRGRGQHGLLAPAAPLDCGSSGATMRLLAGLLSGQRFSSILDGSAQLRRRPMGRISDPLRACGAAISDSAGHAPLHLGGQPALLRGGDVTLAVASAQVKSALLLAGLYAAAPLTVIEPASTRDHTERLLTACGLALSRQPTASGGQRLTLTPPTAALRPLNLTIPGDFSSAAFWIVAALLHPDSTIRLPGVGINPTRTGLLDALALMGAQVAVDDRRGEGSEPLATLGARSARLHGCTLGGALVVRSIDELPLLAVAATQADGVTTVGDAGELRVKESNRIEDLCTELRRLGAAIEPTADGFVVCGPTPLHGASVDSHGDHRLAMALAVAGLCASGNTTVRDADCVAKTYPGFFADLASLSDGGSRG